MVQEVKKLVKKAKHIVCIMGQESMTECGGPNLWSPDNFYRIEKEYGKSPEEMLSAGELTARKVYFYNFYKKEVISTFPEPGPTYTAMKKLQEAGKLSEIISFNIYGLEYRAGLRNVIELAGSVYDNYCPLCKKRYPVEYLTESKGMPLCEECKAAVRPNIRLHSEKVQNDLYTQAVLACRNADMILVVGGNLSGSKMRYCTGHYEGDKLVVIHSEPHYTDKYADYVICDSPKNVLPLLVEGV
ncbi:MAG: NAD-dependent deacetylase [Lachnospiraceae bacterium]|nr:NAD-dependent deacetylase [Lachnospiraceae bacterium]